MKSTPAPTGTDHDGMPDDWERVNGLDPENADDCNMFAENGYSMLEKYLTSLK